MRSVVDWPCSAITISSNSRVASSSHRSYGMLPSALTASRSAPLKVHTDRNVTIHTHMKREWGWTIAQEHTLVYSVTQEYIHTLAKCLQSQAEFALVMGSHSCFKPQCQLEKVKISRLNEELHQASVPTGGSSVQRCPQLAVAGVHAGSSVQQTLHHLHKVINAALTGQKWHILHTHMEKSRSTNSLLHKHNFQGEG